jgi:hypothetical protein
MTIGLHQLQNNNTTNMKNIITNFTQRWLTLLKLNNDVNSQSKRSNNHSKKSVELTDVTHKHYNYAKQIRYMYYMGRRIDHLLDNQN